jgi:hypothetical protein
MLNVLGRLLALSLLCASCATTPAGSTTDDAFFAAKFAAEARAAMDNGCDRVKVGEVTDTSDEMVGEVRMRKALVAVKGCGSSWRYAVVCEDDACVSKDVLKGQPSDADGATTDAAADPFDIVRAAAVKQAKVDTSCADAEATTVRERDDQMVGSSRMRRGVVKVRGCGGDTWLYGVVCDGDTCVAHGAEKPAAPPDEFDLGDLSNVDVSGPID